MRSIFSFVASQQLWLACAAASAWLAVDWAPLAAEAAEAAALPALSAALLAAATCEPMLETCDFRV
jgi:hypothetical protein